MFFYICLVSSVHIFIQALAIQALTLLALRVGLADAYTSLLMKTGSCLFGLSHGVRMYSDERIVKLKCVTLSE